VFGWGAPVPAPELVLPLPPQADMSDASTLMCKMSKDVLRRTSRSDFMGPFGVWLIGIQAYRNSRRRRTNVSHRHHSRKHTVARDRSRACHREEIHFHSDDYLTALRHPDDISYSLLRHFLPLSTSRDAATQTNTMAQAGGASLARILHYSCASQDVSQSTIGVPPCCTW